MLVDLLVKLVKALWSGLRRVANVKRSAPEEHPTATDYADAFLFADNDPNTSDSTPPSILVGMVARLARTCCPF
jgi:hypothetical protein